MQKILLFLFFLISFICLGQTNPNHVYVKGYTRKDGTYVQGYYRTAPNSTNRDNFSTKGNTNPYTGKPGWIPPDNYTQPNSNYSTNKNVYASTTPKYLGSYNEKGQKVINYTNGKEVFDICNSCYISSYNQNLTYHWYSPYSGVHESKGTSQGKLLNGEYKFFDEYGDLRIVSHYSRGLRNGYEIIWDESGDISQKSHYVQGKMDYYRFKNEDNYIIELDGPLLEKGSIKRVYTTAGKLIEESVIVENVRSHYKIYNEDSGVIEKEFTKSFGDRYFGKYIVYYQNGTVKFKGFFKDGFPDETWKWYDKKGQLIDTLKYRVFKKTYPNGETKLKGSEYYNSYSSEWVRDDIWYFYPNDGSSEIKKIIYKDGEIQELE